nr:GRIP1-associated protein 1-like [Zootoca vivipara]
MRFLVLRYRMMDILYFGAEDDSALAASLPANPLLYLQSTTGSPQSQSQPPRPADLSDEEISELFQRLAEVQQEKWLLEEKVKHLEVSSASMAEDLCRKSAIIETYVMDSRIGEDSWQSGGNKLEQTRG